MTKLPALSFLFLVSAFAACDNDEDGGLSKGGVPSEKLVSQLSTSEMAQLCKNVEEVAEHALSPNFLKALCNSKGYFKALRGSGTKMECKQGYDQCLTQEQEPDQDPCVPDPDCKATVAEVEKCYVERVAALKALFNKYPTCDDLTQRHLEDEQLNKDTVWPQPPSCVEAKAKCRGFVD